MPYTLLLADDSVTIQRVIELTFADEDIQVVAVSDGDQDIERLNAHPPDIVLADVGMPGKDGYEVARYIKQTPDLAHIPVLLLTGAFEPVDQERAAAAGCDGVLAKPFEPQLVIGRVKELLARWRETALPGETPARAEPTPSWPTPSRTPMASAPPLRPTAPPMAERTADPVSQENLEDYFDRLDAAFADLSMKGPAEYLSPPPVSVDVEPELEPEPEPDLESEPESEPKLMAEPAFELESEPELETEPDAETRAEHESETEIAAEPDSDLEPETNSELEIGPLPPPDDAEGVDDILFEEESEAARSAEATPVSVPVEEMPLAVAAPMPPPLAEAFAALLAAEQRWPAPTAAPARLVDGPSRPPASIDTDAVVDRVTHLVLERLSDRVVRETVGDLVSKIAERLVRDEIERIKATIK